MDITKRQVGDVLIFRISGKLTIGTGDVKLRDAVQKALADGCTKLVLDMEDVTRIDSAGVGQIVAEHISTRNRGGHLKLLRLSEKVGGVLKATRLTGVLEIYDHEADALASFA